LSFGLTIVSVAGLLTSGLASRLAMDHPNLRSLHSRPTPRCGGLGIVAGLLTGSTLVSGVPVLLPALVLVLAGVSFLNDRIEIPIVARLGVHMLAGSAWAMFVLAGDPCWVIAVAALTTVWSTNLYNFMDGADGLAGGMGVLGFGTFAVAGALADQTELIGIAACAAAAAAAFLLFNFPPARIFMGDSGSIPLGFLSAALGVWGWRDGAWPWWFPALVFSPFLVDSSITLARRILRGDRFWQPHKEHYYQRMVRMGWGHRRTALMGYALMAMAAASGIALIGAPLAIQSVAFVFWILLYAFVAGYIDASWNRHVRTAEEAK